MSRAIARLLFDQACRRWLVAFEHQLPDLPFRVAEAREGAQGCRIFEHYRRAFDAFRLHRVGPAAGGLCANEARALVSAITERFAR